MEEKGITTVTLNLFKEFAETVKPPRTLHLKFPFGSPVGKPNDIEQQKQVILEAFKLLEDAEIPGVIKKSNLKYK